MFWVLCREFFAQFFASESVTSDMQLRQAMIGVLAFILTPGLFVPIQMSASFEIAVLRFPALLEPLTRLMATVFIVYSMVAIGVIAAVMWDSLAFDRRDAMVLGPLPLSARTIVAAKLTAMGAFLLITAAGVNVITAVLFSMVAGNHKGMFGIVRHFVAHMVTTVSAAAFVFCLLVTVRAIVGGVAGRRVALSSILRFLLFSALLCFIVYVPTALHVVPGGRRRPSTVYMQPIPGWSPTNWFLGLYEWIRGSPGIEWEHAALRAVGITAAMVTAAVVMTIAGYRRQMQLALAPSAWAATHSAARAPRAIAYFFVFGNRLARAISDFILMTLARSSAQQVTIAMNAALGLTLVVASLARTRGDLALLMRPRTAVLWIPLVLTYWVAVGLRAAFFVPSELPASWTFRFHAPMRTAAYWSAVRASAIGFLVPVALLADALIAPLIGIRAAVFHGAIVVSVAVLMAQTIALTVDFVPFTRPYAPGHARLKTRWPLYLLGLWVFAFWPARLAMRAAGDEASMLQIAGWVLAAAAVLEIVGRVLASRWQMDPAEEFEDGGSRIAVLDIGMFVHGAAPP